MIKGCTLPKEIFQLAFYFLIAILFVSVAWWCVICAGLSLLSGWHQLARRFPSRGAPSSKARRAGPFLFGVKMRFSTDYSNTIRLASDDRALHLSVALPLRVFHPPLSIPWNEIERNTARHRSRDVVVLTLGREQQIPLRLSEGVAAKLELLEKAKMAARV